MRMCSWSEAETVHKMDNSTPTNASLSNDDDTGFKIPLGYHIVAYLAIVLGFSANPFICFSFAYFRRVRSVNNYFVVNLAVIDILFIILLCIQLAAPAQRFPWDHLWLVQTPQESSFLRQWNFSPFNDKINKPSGFAGGKETRQRKRGFFGGFLSSILNIFAFVVVLARSDNKNRKTSTSVTWNKKFSQIRKREFEY